MVFDYDHLMGGSQRVQNELDPLDRLTYATQTPFIELLHAIAGDSHAVSFGSPRRASLCRGRPDVERAMQGLIDWLNSNQRGIVAGNPIVRAIMAHYYLTEIHPFGDGNGRTARALEALVLYKNGINPYCFWSLANFWSRNREKYIVHLRNVYETEDAWPLIMWGLDGFRQELERIKGLVLKKMKQLMLMDYVKYLLDNKSKQKVKITPRIVEVMELLIDAGRIPMKDFMAKLQIEKLYKGSPSTKSRDFAKMRKLQLISITQAGDTKYIEPNYQILDSHRYRV